MTIPREEWEWFGSAGHLIVGSDCRFHLATLIGPWWVSTVGEWLPDSNSWDIYARKVGGIPPDLRGDDRRAWFLKHVGYVEIGAGRTYETMVFRADPEQRCERDECNCGQPEIVSWSELDSDVYSERGDAQRGHYALCERWAAIGDDEPGEAA